METSILIWLTLLVALLSIGLSTLSIWRMMLYIRTYRFERGQYTPLFKIIPLRLLIVIYAIGVIVIAGFSLGVFLAFI